MISLDISDGKFYIRGDINYLKNDDVFNPTYFQLTNPQLFGFFLENDYLLTNLNNENIENFSERLLSLFNTKNIEYELLTESLQQVSNNLEIFQENSNRAQIFKEFIRDYRDRQKPDELPEGLEGYNEYIHFLEQNVNRKLKSHQLESSYHLSVMGNSANFSVPGSGKTSVILSYYEYLKFNNIVDKLFVVGPLSSFYPWISEFNLTLDRDPKEVDLTSLERRTERINFYNRFSFVDSELILISYHSLINDTNSICNYLDSAPVLLVLDESHYMKNPDSNRAVELLQISPYAKTRIILSGTPMPHSFRDLVTQFKFLYPSRDIIPEEMAYDMQSNEQVLNEVRNRIFPMYYRVSKNHLGLAPQNFNPPEIIEMNPIEREIYTIVTNRILLESKLFDNSVDVDLLGKFERASVMRSRQCLSYVSLLTTAIEEYEDEDDFIIQDSYLIDLINSYDSRETPAKIEYLINLVRDILSQNKKVVIWATFEKTILLIHKYMQENNFNSEYIYGKVPKGNPNDQSYIYESADSNNIEKTRVKIINKFNDPNSDLKVLIANPAACSESISLHKVCQDAIYYDLSYNGAEYMQSLDRIHRVGGSEEKTSNYYFLQYSGTHEFSILDNLERKKRRMEDFLNSDELIMPIEGDVREDYNSMIENLSD